jgi:hypothetical protein
MTADVAAADDTTWHLQLGAVQFHLVTTTILQISREGFRRGCVRASDDDSKVGVAAAAANGSSTGARWWCACSWAHVQHVCSAAAVAIWQKCESGE